MTKRKTKKVKLSEYVAEHGQSGTARQLGMKQGALYQALKNERDITIIIYSDGSISGEEVKAFPSR